MEKKTKALKTIAEVSDLLLLPKTVLRFWEKNFDSINPLKINSVRYYSQQDIKEIEKIKELLYVKNYTIKKTQELLKEAKKLDNIKNLKKLLKKLYDIKQELNNHLESQ